jgi:hypothetical protein
MATVTGSFVASGRNPSVEIQQLRLVYSNTSITVSGSTASTTVSATLSVKRDSYGPSFGQTAVCYITIDGNKKTANYTDTVDTSWRTVMSHSVKVSYTASSDKTISLGAGFNMSSNSKLKGLVLPASSYAYGTGTQSGSLSLKLAKQITKCGAPTSVTLTRNSGSGSTILPNETIKISWSGAKSGTSNTIATYQVYYRITSNDSAPTTSTYSGTKNVDVTNGTTSGSTTITLSGATRGYTVVAGVVTRGTAGSSYYSGIKTGGKLKVNSLPGAPSVTPSATTVRSTGNNVSFTVTAGSDSDGQTRTLYYSRTSGGAKTKFTSPVSLSISSGNNSVYFYTYDGMEYSSATAKTISINTKPVIKSISTTKTELEGINGSASIPLVRKASFSASLNKTVTSYTWYFAQSSTSSISTSTKTSFSTSSSLSNYNFDALSITKGYYYKVGLIVSDAYESSDIVWETGSAQLPKHPSAATITSIINTKSGTTIAGTNANQFEDGVTVKWTNPAVSGGMLDIVDSKAIYRVRANSGSSWGGIIGTNNGSLTPGAANTSFFSVSANRGYQVQFGVRIRDSGDATADVYYSSLFTRAQLPYFANTTLNITGPNEAGKVTVRPYTNTTPLGFTSIKAISDNGARYYLDCIVNDKSVTITFISNKDKAEVENGDSTSIEIAADTVNTLLKDNRLKANSGDSVWNNNYSNVTYRMYVKDLFGNTSSNSVITSATNVNFIETPTFPTSQTITMGIQYYLPNKDTDSFASSIKYPSTESTITAKQINNDRMYNPGEAIVFKFNKPHDYNEDVVAYRIYAAITDTRPLSISKDNNYEEYEYSVLEDRVLPSSMKTGETETELIYQRAVDSRTINKFVIFYIVAIDSHNNVSNKIYSNTYLVGCRKQTPTATLDSATVNEQNKISISYSIQDLGGSQFENSLYKYKAGTDENSYPNFERDISIKLNSSDSAETTYTPKTFIHIQYCLDGDFDNQISTNYAYQIIPLDTDYPSLGGTVQSEDIGTFGGKKLYIRIRVVLLTGFGESNENYGNIGDYTKYNIVSTTTEIITYYADMPTVSHRAHHVGINTNNFDDLNENEVLVISDFMEREKIVLVGTDTSTGEAQEYRITIYLKQGKIDGAYIPGGNWDEEETISLFAVDDGTPFYVQGGGND